MADINKFQGLSFDFQITTEGKFELSSGHKKAQDNFLFFFAFAGWFRPYFQDYCSPLWELVNRPNTVFASLRTIVFGRIQRAIRKYMPYVDVEDVNFVNDPQDKKTYLISLVYKFRVRLEDEENLKLFAAKVISNGN